MKQVKVKVLKPYNDGNKLYSVGEVISVPELIANKKRHKGRFEVVKDKPEPKEPKAETVNDTETEKPKKKVTKRKSKKK